MPTVSKKKAPSSRTPRKLLPVQLLPIDKIEPAGTNRDADRNIDDLAASIREHGQQSPIKVRPRGERYEIVYGERRWRAMKRLRIAQIAAIVEDLTDADAEEQRVVENSQRVDPHALEEAEAYERLLALRDSKDKALHTPESIAAAVGRSPGYVYNRLKLTALAPELRKAFYAAQLTTTTAFLIARSIPTELQGDLWARIREETAHSEYDDSALDDEGHLRSRLVQDLIETEFSTRLDTAAFSLKDSKLVPSAGSCAACPKRARNQPQLFSDDERKRPDSCGDVPCFRAKTEAYVAREKDRTLAAGGAIAPPEECRRIFNGGAALPWNSPWVHLDAVCYEDPKQRTYRKLLGDLCPQGLLTFTSQSKPMLLAEKKSVDQLLAQTGLLKKTTNLPNAKSAAHHDDPNDDFEDEDLPDDHPASSARRGNTDPVAARSDARVRAEVERRLMAAVADAAGAAAPDDNRFVDLIFAVLLKGGFSNALHDVYRRRSLLKTKGEAADQVVAAHALSLTPMQKRALVLEVALSRANYVYAGDTYSRLLTEAVSAYAIDLPTIEKAAAAHLAAKASARPDKAEAVVASAANK